MAPGNFKKIIVIGASAGGFEVLLRLFENLPPDLPATFVVVMHMSHAATGEGLANQLKKVSDLEIKVAEDGEKLKSGVVYLAPPNFHTIVKEGNILTTNGPLENKYRPSIDQLFRSVAVVYKSKTIGIVLSGMLDDGTSGMIAIKKTGGTLVIQDPFEAAFSDMPLSVKGNVEVDHISSVIDMPALIVKLVEEDTKPDLPVPPDIVKEVEIAERLLTQIEDTEQIGQLSPYICPDCGGTLFMKSEENLIKFRCHTGHVYSSNILLMEKTQEIEESIWVAIRLLEEKRNLLLLMAQKDKGKAGSYPQAYLKRANDSKAHIDRLRALIQMSNHFLDN